MRKTLLFVLLLLLFFSAESQLAGKTWLLGGNASFESQKYTSDFGSNTTRGVEVSGNVGYFFVDKLAAGVRPQVRWSHVKNAFNDLTHVKFTIGPFVRYYFLPIDGKVNLFVEVNYAYRTERAINNNKLHWNKYAFVGGPVLFLNSAVAIELSVGYTILRPVENGARKYNSIQTQVGFQFHLIKDDQ